MRLTNPGSLKERRHVVRSIQDGVRNRFSLSCSDLGPADKWQDAELGFAGAGSSPSELEERLRNLESFLARKEADGEFEMVRFDWEVFAYGDL